MHGVKMASGWSRYYYPGETWVVPEPSITRVRQTPIASMVRRLLRSDWSADMGAIFGQAVMIDYIAASQLFQLQVYYAL